MKKSWAPGPARPCLTVSFAQPKHLNSFSCGGEKIIVSKQVPLLTFALYSSQVIGKKIPIVIETYHNNNNNHNLK